VGLKKIAIIGSFVFSSIANAGGWTKTGAVEFVEVVRAQGFIVKGDFGSAIGCSNAVADFLWVAADHPQYDQLYSTALAAFMGGKKLKAYAHTCTAIGWHGGEFSTLNASGSLYISN
jgi:hypothetical protein